jgi:four helix bundle protein
MGFIKFEDIIAWQKSRELVIKIYHMFKVSKDFGFKNQIERASVSVMNNIAEGFERRTNNEFRYFLYVSKGSVGEVRSMLYLALDLEKISNEDFKELYDLTNEVSKLLTGLIKTMN